MNFIEEFFGKYDERSETIERAAGDMGFKLLWVLILMVLIMIPVLVNTDMEPRDVLGTVFIVMVASLMVSLFVKYCYCWMNNITRGRVIAKFASALVLSFVFGAAVLSIIPH